MTQLLVRNVPDSIAKKLKLRAVENGVSAEEEHRRILRAALEKPAGETKPKRTLYDAFIELGQIAPDFEFEQKRTRSKRRPIEF